MTKSAAALLIALSGLLATPAWCWSNHSLLSYRAFERMPEVAGAAPVTVEPLEAFLKAQETAIAELLASQEAWARANIDSYAPRAETLTFKADATRSDAQRRLAFVTALRISPLSKFALYLQSDPRSTPDATKLLPYAAVDFLPEQPNESRRFVAIAAGEAVPALAVLASASDEPDYGLDINLWQDSPSDWGKTYGFGNIPFGNPALYFSTQAPFHMGFYHQDWLIFKAAPFIRRTYPLLRIQQYSSLAALAFRSGHAYWGWRFSGLALHYMQDLSQPYHASLAPGDSTLRMISANVMAMAGFPKRRDDLIILLSNRHLALEKYQNQSMLASARAQQDESFELALRLHDLDASYSGWSDLYARDVVSAEAYAIGARAASTIVAAMPPRYVDDPSFDFGVKEAGIDLRADMVKVDPARRADLDRLLAELLGRVGAHSRNTVRAILKAGARP